MLIIVAVDIIVRIELHLFHNNHFVERDEVTIDVFIERLVEHEALQSIR